MACIEKRITAEGHITHRVLIRRKGYKAESATFTRLTDARDWARETEAAMKAGRYFKTAESKKHTVSDLIDRYMKHMERENLTRHHDIKTQMRWWKDELGHCILADLSKAKITEKIDSLSARERTLKDGSTKKISPASVNRYIAAFSHACTLAHTQWEWLETHPLSKIKKRPEPRGRVRYLNDQERERLIQACRESENPLLYPVVILALSTGARQGEILNIKRQDIDITRKVIILHDTKNKERRVLPLAGHALNLIESLLITPTPEDSYLFPSQSSLYKPFSIRLPWEQAVAKAELKDFRFHDLRHSAASYLAMNGASLTEIAEVLGHKTLQMVKRYAHLSESHTHGVVARMNERIFGEKA